MALPSQLKYGNKPETASARSYTSIIQPEGSMSGYGPNSTVKFNIPCQNNTVLVPSETYLKLTLSGITNGAVANHAIRLDGAGIHGCIQRMRVYHGSTEINDIDNYGMFAKLMMSLQQSSDSFCSKQNVMSGTFSGYNSAGNNVAFLPLIGERLTNAGPEVYAEVPANGVVADRNYAISLISYVGTLGGDKYIPCYEMTSSPLRLELQFVSSALKFLNSKVALAAGNSFQINNLELVCTFIELSDDVVATLRERQMSLGQPLQYVVPNYSNVSANATIATATTTRVTHQISARYASLKSIFCTMRSKADGQINFFPLSSTHFNLSYWNFRIGSQLVPSKQVSTLQESYCELLKAIGSIADLNHEPSINYQTYLKDAIPAVSAEAAGALAESTKSNSFAIGLDLETYQNSDRDSLWSAMNTLTSDIFLNADFAGGIGADTNVLFNFYSMFDQVLVFENGGCRVVK